jgi:hypothetical protein
MHRVLSSTLVLGIISGCAGAAPSTAPSQGPGSPALSDAPSVSPATSVSPPPSTSPAASAVYPEWYTGERQGAGILSAGSHATRNFRPAFTFTVPAGWFNNGDESNSYTLIPDTPANAAEQAASGGLDNEIAVHRYATPYWMCAAWEDRRGGTADEIVASLVANEAIATSEPLDVTVGGLNGKQVDIQLDPGWTETCPGDPPTFDLADTRVRAILLDTPDRDLMFINVNSLHSANHEVFLAGAMSIIESFRFDAQN